MSERVYLVVSTRFDGQPSYALDRLWSPVSAREQERRGVLEAIELSDVAKALSLDALVALHRAGEMSNPVYRVPPPPALEAPVTKANHRYREPRKSWDGKIITRRQPDGTPQAG